MLEDISNEVGQVKNASLRILDKLSNVSMRNLFSPKRILKRLLRLESNSLVSRYSWPCASVVLGLFRYYERTKDDEVLNAIKSYLMKYSRIANRITLLDHVMNCYVLGCLQKAALMEDGPCLKNAFSFLSRLQIVSKGKSHIPYRETRSTWCYVDTLGMICPFLSVFGHIYGSKEASDLATHLIVDFVEKSFDRKSGLPYHAYDASSGEKLGIIGWGRGVGWLMLSLVDTIEFVEDVNRSILIEIFGDLVANVSNYQCEDGLFSWQLSAFEGHKDSSASSMIGYAIKRGIDLGIISTGYTRNAQQCAQSILVSSNDGIIGSSSAECKGIGQYPYIFTDNAWGQGFGLALLSLFIDS